MDLRKRKIFYYVKKNLNSLENYKLLVKQLLNSFKKIIIQLMLFCREQTQNPVKFLFKNPEIYISVFNFKWRKVIYLIIGKPISTKLKNLIVWWNNNFIGEIIQKKNINVQKWNNMKLSTGLMLNGRKQLPMLIFKKLVVHLWKKICIYSLMNLMMKRL